MLHAVGGWRGLAETILPGFVFLAVLLVGVLDKVGTFGILRYCLPLFPEASQWATPVIITLALVSLFVGAFLAIGQDDMLGVDGLAGGWQDEVLVLLGRERTLQRLERLVNFLASRASRDIL